MIGDVSVLNKYARADDLFEEFRFTRDDREDTASIMNTKPDVGVLFD